SSLMLLLPLLLIYRTFTEDRRLIWTGVWLFFVANWVGQDYFSPQSVAFALHLGVLAVVLRRYGRSGGARRRGQAVWTAVIVVMVTAIVISHQLTPGMLRSEEHTSELQSRENLVCRLLLEKKKN